jgi:threonine dehydratase
VQKTPLQKAKQLSEQLSCNIYLKREDLQEIYSFKIRGAFNKILHLSEQERLKGIIAASAGNHAQGVALSAKQLGLKATIVMPKTAPQIKIDAVKSFGANVVLHGDNYSEAQAECDRIAKITGQVFVHPFDDDLVIDGQGTIAQEILEDNPSITHIFVCVGGGGMLAGVSKVAKSFNPFIKIISVEPTDSAAMKTSIEADQRVELERVGTFADGVAVKQVGEKTFEIAKTSVDDFITVTVDEICSAIKAIFQDTRSIVEPAGALGVAGARKYSLPKDAEVAIICSGANMTFEKLQYISERTLVGDRQEALYSIELPEKPGALRSFCDQIVTDHGITEFSYRLNDRSSANFFIGVKISGNEDKTKLEELMTINSYRFIDFTDDDTTKEHVRHMIGGKTKNATNEVVYNISFPEHPRALQAFLESIGESFNISLFHYRSIGADTGNVMMGFECDDQNKLEMMLKRVGYPYELLESQAVDLFL